MKKKTISAVIAIIFLSVFAGFLIGAQSGCDKAKSRSEYIGFPQSFADLAEKVKPAVVNISTETTVKMPGRPFRHFFGPEEDPFRDFSHRFFGDIPDREFKQQSLGSGFIIDKDGYIITNNHVVEDADEIKVKLADGREFGAKVVGRDPKTDLALIKISSIFINLPTLALGDSDKMRVGDWVLAVGNPFGLEHTVTQGIISATGRVIGSGPYDNFLQTDAPINPGNSGGPLVNLKGEVIGINSAINPAGQGIGFAIPISMAKTIISQIKETGKVVRGWIGVSVQSITPEIAQAFELNNTRGALVSEVVPGSPADSAGMKRGDVIVSFNGKDVHKMNDLPRVVAETPVGKTVDIRIVREKEELVLKIKIAELTEEKLAYQDRKTGDTLGLSVDDITPRWRSRFGLRENTGVVVVEVLPGSAAEKSGIAPGDIIKEVNHTAVHNLSDYNSIIGKSGRNKAVLFLISRADGIFFVTVDLS
ncbi:MAG: DegQ family serine endoprotease [Nitrospirota bacterium]|nr:DegQ family serine endoprotease [Nitrospirota bacterium]